MTKSDELRVGIKTVYPKVDREFHQRSRNTSVTSFTPPAEGSIQKDKKQLGTEVKKQTDRLRRNQKDVTKQD